MIDIISNTLCKRSLHNDRNFMNCQTLYRKIFAESWKTNFLFQIDHLMIYEFSSINL